MEALDSDQCTFYWDTTVPNRSVTDEMVIVWYTNEKGTFFPPPKKSQFS